MIDDNLNKWFNSGEYKTDLSSALRNIIKKVNNSDNESQIVQYFTFEIYDLLRNKAMFEPLFKTEVKISGIIHQFNGEVKVGTGRADAIVNNLLIEFKQPSKLQTTKQINNAIQQVKNYLLTLKREQNKAYDAILTDGINISYFSICGNVVSHTMLKNLTVSDIDVIIRAIVNVNTKRYVAENLVRDFSVSDKYKTVSKELAYKLYKTLSSNPSDKTKMLYSEWKSLSHLSTDDNGKSQDIEKRRNDLTNIFSTRIDSPDKEYQALYCLQTTYAIIVKLIACKVIDHLNFNSKTNEYNDLLRISLEQMKDFFQKLEDGYSYTSENIRNLLEGDFFSWYTENNLWDYEFYLLIKEIVFTIDQYSTFSLDVTFEPIDLFKDLYMSIIPQSVRHSTGEYFTPEWLADSVIDMAKKITNREVKAIDPCCGSGIFMMRLIKHIVGNQSPREMTSGQKESLVKKILNNVHGVDLNPLAVLSARVSYFIALSKLDCSKNVELPVYLGDSAIVPQKKNIDGIECYYYSVTTLKGGTLDVVLPTRLVHQNNFGVIMSDLQSVINAENEGLLYNSLAHHLTEAEKASQLLMDYLLQLSERLVSLHRNKWDGIWIRIVTNFFMVGRLHDYDLIVGNPPWVKWEHLPSQYTEKIKVFCDVRHIFCNDGGRFGGAQLNICALIANVAASNWLKSGGCLAFLMPDSLMSANSFEEYRNFYITPDKSKRLYLQALDKWKAPLRPFRMGNKVVTQDFNTYFYSDKTIDYKIGINVRTITKKRGADDTKISKALTFEEASQYLVFGKEKAIQLADASTAFTYASDKFDFTKIIGPHYYRYRTGVESTPFEVFKFTAEGPSDCLGHYKFKNLSLATSRYKVKGIPNEGWELPTAFMYPMIGGPDISPFSFVKDVDFHIIPYEINNLKKPLPLEDLYRSYPLMAKYFISQKKLLDSQSNKSKEMHCGSEFYAVSKIGTYTFAPHIVAARDNSNFCSTIISPILTPWGELKKPVCVKHSIIISQDIFGQFITEDEAHYINGILNSTIVIEYMHSTFKKNSFSLNKSNLFIPKYEPGNPSFEKIVKLSKEATAKPDICKKIQDELTIAYLNLCDQKNSNSH